MIQGEVSFDNTVIANWFFYKGILRRTYFEAYFISSSIVV